MSTKLGGEVASDEQLLSKKPHNSFIMWTHQVTWQTKKRYISIFIRPVATKLDKMVVASDMEP